MSIITLKAKWRSQEFTLTLKRSSTIFDIKKQLQLQISIDPSCMKLMILGSLLYKDSTRLSDIRGLSSPQSITILATNLKDPVRSTPYLPITHQLTEKQHNEILIKKNIDLVKEEMAISRLPLHHNNHQEGASSSNLNFGLIEKDKYDHNVEAEHESYHDIEPLSNPTGKFRTQLPIFSNSSDDTLSILKHTNQIILPPSVLAEVTRQTCEFPLIFKITLATSNEVNPDQFATHATALSFTASQNVAYASHRMVQFLGRRNSPYTIHKSPNQKYPSSIESSDSNNMEGVLVNIETVVLPPGEFCELRPLSISWIQNIPQEQQRPVLESYLRYYQCLTLGEIISIVHGGIIYEFRITALVPEGQGICIIDRCLQVDILEPEQMPEIHQIRGLSEYNPVGELISTEKEENNIYLSKGQFRFYQLELVQSQLVLQIEIITQEGPPCSFYVSTTNKYPVENGCSWCSENENDLTDGERQLRLETGGRRLEIGQDDPNFSTGCFYIGVYSKYGDSKFCIKFSIRNNENQILKSLDSGQRAAAAIPPPMDSEKCTNCMRWIPKTSYTLHSAQCSRHNWKCDKCSLIIKSKDKDQHMAVIHARVQCECQFEAEQDLMPLHKEYECIFRPFECPYCQIVIPFNQKILHMTNCGNRTVSCPECAATIRNCMLKVHMAQKHLQKTTTSDI